MEIFMRSLEIAAYIIASCSVVLQAVSKMSKNTWDDKLAAWWKKWPIKALQFFSLMPRDPSKLPPAP